MWNLQWHDRGTMRRDGEPRKLRKKARSEYAERDRLLGQLGFANYREYLASGLWSEPTGEHVAEYFADDGGYLGPDGDGVHPEFWVEGTNEFALARRSR